LEKGLRVKETRMLHLISQQRWNVQSYFSGNQKYALTPYKSFEFPIIRIIASSYYVVETMGMQYLHQHLSSTAEMELQAEVLHMAYLQFVSTGMILLPFIMPQNEHEK